MAFGNYATKALAAMEMTADHFARNGWPTDAENYRALLESIKRSQVFSLPRNGLLFEHDATRYVPSCLMLPYPVTCLEFLADESSLLPPGPVLVILHQLGRSIGICALRRARVHWIEMASGRTLFIDDADGPVESVSGAVDIPIVHEPRSLFEESLKDYLSAEHLSIDEFIRKINGALSQISFRVMQFLCALECKNVRVESAAPDAKLNAARARKGKLPLVSYKVLTLDSTPKRIADSRGGGTHASPRTHLRRGHIRRLAAGNVWVNSTVVNGKSTGLVLKDYEVLH